MRIYRIERRRIVLSHERISRIFRLIFTETFCWFARAYCSYSSIFSLVTKRLYILYNSSIFNNKRVFKSLPPTPLKLARHTRAVRGTRAVCGMGGIRHPFRFRHGWITCLTYAVCGTGGRVLTYAVCGTG